METIDYNAMRTVDLREKGREARNAGSLAFADVSGVSIAGMLRAELIARLSGTYAPPERHPNAVIIEAAGTYGNGGNGNGNGNGTKPTGTDAELIDVLARVLGGKLNVNQQVDEEKVAEIIKSVIDNSNFVTNIELEQMRDTYEEGLQLMADEIIKNFNANKAHEITVTRPDMSKVDVGIQHEIFEILLRLLSAKKHVFLVGPSGSGKTHIAKGLAEALGIDYKYMLVGPETSKADFFGFRGMADGVYNSTDFYEAYVNGGLILIDELDKGNAGSMCMLNAALDNGFCAFPCGMKPMHPDFRCIASANTYGRGQDKMYCGSQQLDAATLQRFKIIFFDYDKKLEFALCPDHVWVKKIHLLREVVADHKAKIIVSTRAIMAYDMFELGFKEKDILDMTVWQGYNADAVSAITKDWKARIAENEDN